VAGAAFDGVPGTRKATKAPLATTAPMPLQTVTSRMVRLTRSRCSALPRCRPVAVLVWVLGVAMSFTFFLVTVVALGGC
jgi:hypothetical protein